MLYIVKQLKSLLNFYVSAGFNEGGAKVEQDIPSVKEMSENKEYSKEELNSFKEFLEIDKKHGGLDKANKGQVMVYQGLLNAEVDGIVGPETRKKYNTYKSEAISALNISEKAEKKIESKNEIIKETKVKTKEVKTEVESNTKKVEEPVKKEVKTEVKNEKVEITNETINEGLLSEYKNFIKVDSNIGGIENANKGQIMVLQGLLKNRYDLGNFGPNDDGVDGYRGEATDKAYFDYKTKALSYIAKAESNKNLEVKTEVKKEVEVKTENNKTKEEHLKESVSSVLGIESSNSREDLMKEVNLSSLQEMVREGNLSKLISELKNSLKTDNLSKFEFKDTFFTRNYSDIIDVLENAGYSIDGRLDSEEAFAVVNTLDKVNKTQEKIKGLNFRDKVAILLDYNVDGLLDNEQNFETQELKFFEAIKSEKEFNNLLINLGYNGGISEFDEKFSTNYYAERVNFKTRLQSILNSPLNINPVEMLISPNAVKIKAEIFKDATEVIEANEKFLELKSENSELADKLRLETIALVVGQSNGFGVSFDVKEMTKDLLDNVSVGVFNGIPGIAFSKRIVESKDGKFNLDFGAVNFVPYLGGSVKAYEANLGKLKSIFPNEIDENADITFAGALSKIKAVGLVYDRIDESTSRGIERMTSFMEENLDTIFANIKEKKEFKDLGIEATNKNIEAYNALKGLYESAGSNEIAEVLIRNGALNTYKNELYKNAEGFNFAGAGVGIAGTFGYIIPVLGVKFEEIKTSYVEKPRASHVSLPDTFAEGVDVLDPVFKEKVNALGDTITFRTRTNKYAEQILNPSRSLEDRWQGLINFSDRKGRFSPELTKTMNAFKEMVSYAEKDGASKEEKWYVISTVSQFMKKSNDYNNGDLDKWNTETDKLIKTDEERRWHFDGLMGMSLNEEANEYYEKLSKSSGEIGRTTIEGVGFDSMSTLNVEQSKKAIKGVEVLYANLSILTVDGEPLLVKIENDSKIKGFVEKIKTIPMEESIRQNLIKSIESGDTELYFYKDPEGFDDRILPMIKGETRETIPVFKQVNEVTDYLFGYAGKKHNVDDKSKSTTTTDPDNPNTGSGGSGNTSGGAGQGNTGGNKGGGGGVQIP